MRALGDGLTSMNPVAAVCFMLLAPAIWLLKSDFGSARAVGAGIAAFVSIVAALRILGYIGGLDPGIDRALFSHAIDAEPVPNRMAPNTAVCFLVVSLGLMTIGARTKGGIRLSHVAAALSGTIALSVLAGYMYGAGAIQQFAYAPMALNSALLFVVSAVAVVALRPEGRVLQGFTSFRAGGVMARRMLAATVSVPIVLGWLCLWGERAGMYGAESTLALFVVGTILVMATIVWLGAQALDRADLWRSRSEEQLRLSEEAAQAARAEAERANQAKSAFLSRMSHELRTPLNSVLGFGQLMEMQGLDGKQAEYMQCILRGGNHLMELINEVLDIARIESGRFSMTPESVHVHSVVQDALALVTPMADQQNMSLAAEVEEGIYVRADRQRMTQVLLNLLSNAIKYNVDGGSVSVSCTVKSGGVHLGVADTGPGIADEDMARLFRPFERLENASGIEGTGLGLSLSRRLAQAMGGDVTAKQRAEGGMLFEVRLPVADAPSEATTRRHLVPALVEAGDEMKTILHIEDDATNRKLVEQLLVGRHDVEVISAAQGSDGLELAEERRPDLILLDLHLPDIHGQDVLRALKNDRQLREIPVVIVSADATPGQAELMAEAGAHAFFTKPVELEAFFDVIHGLLGDQRLTA